MTRWHVTRETSVATLPPGVIGAVAALGADGDLAVGGAVLAAACAATAAAFAAVDTVRSRRADRAAARTVAQLRDTVHRPNYRPARTAARRPHHAQP